VGSFGRDATATLVGAAQGGGRSWPTASGTAGTPGPTPGARSGQPIGDERLAADPLAELTVQEAAAAERGALEEGDDAVGLVSPSHPFEVLADPAITPEEEQASEEDDDEPAPEPISGIHIERDNRTR
jgi:hypothetical protein